MGKIVFVDSEVIIVGFVLVSVLSVEVIVLVVILVVVGSGIAIPNQENELIQAD